MTGETNLNQLIKGMKPLLNEGEYVFSTIKNTQQVDRADTLGEFKEKEGTTIIIERTKADSLHLQYDYIASWITLTIHSSLDAVGLTAIFSTTLAKNGLSCNVIAGYYHDHIFVAKQDSTKAIQVLNDLANVDDNNN